MEFFRLPGQFRSHMEQYEKDKKEESRRYRQQLTETTKQINRLNKHIITTKVKFEKVQENIDLMGKEIKKEFSEEIKGINCIVICDLEMYMENNSHKLTLLDRMWKAASFKKVKIFSGTLL